MTGPVGSVALLTGLAWAAGRAVLMSRRMRADPVASFAVTALVGASALAAIGNAVLLLGGGRTGAFVGCGLMIGFGLFTAGRSVRRRPGASDTRPDPETGPDLSVGGALEPKAPMWAGLATAVIIGGLLAPSALTALQSPPWHHDAAFVWWPKVAEIHADRDPGHVPPGGEHKQSQHPRGHAWLVVLGAVGREPDPRSLRWLGAWLLALTALSVLAFAEHVCGAPARTPWAGMGAAVGVVCVPDVVARSVAGTVDVGFGGPLLLVCFGLSIVRSEAGLGWVLTVAGAAGAAALKQEGLVVALVAAGALVAHRAGLRSWRWPPAAALGLLALSVVPYALWRSEAPAGYLSTLETFAREPAMLVARCFEVPGHLVLLWTDPNALPAVRPEPALPWPWTPWILLVALAVAVVRGTRPLVIWPAGLLLLADLAVCVVTPFEVRWHVASSVVRLLVQVSPVLVAATLLRLLGSSRDRPLAFRPTSANIAP